MKDRILIKRNVLRIVERSKNAAAYCVKLLNQFGVIVDKPQYVSGANLNTVADFYGVNIPEGFYKNPQHTKYFTAEELVIEQLISYFTVKICGANSLNEEVFTRKPIFKKALPDYQEGDEVKIRRYRMLTDAECDEILRQVADDYVSYTRKWSNDESAELKWLYMNGYYNGSFLKCKDNAIEMFLEFKNKSFAEMLDKKDVVKMSVEQFGETETLNFSDDDRALFDLAVKSARDCPLSRKQAKYYNAIIKNAKIDAPKASNEESVYKIALNTLKTGDVVGAAKIFANSGSLLARNIVFLLSRSNAEQAREITGMLKCDNPIALVQLLYGICLDDGKSKRTFSFVKNRLYKSHEETDYEFDHRKSVLNSEIRDILKQALYAKIREYYSGRPSLGKIYLSKQFKNVAPPVNTSASGSGLDVLPTGSRLPVKGDYLRAFCYWNNAFDIDASVVFIDGNDETSLFYWGSYSLQPFGKSAMCSGDDRSANGAEYCDFNISELLDLGYKYAVYCLNGYGSTLDEGEIYCGYQDKSNLETDAWSAKNIEFKIRVKGKTRFYLGFALDLERRETVVLNRAMNSDARVVNDSQIQGIKQMFDRKKLEIFSMYDLIALRGEITDSIEDADVVFDVDYMPKDSQSVIRPHDIEKLVNLLK